MRLLLVRAEVGIAGDIDAQPVGGARHDPARLQIGQLGGDWSERRQHLAGALLSRFEELGWARRVAQSRVVAFSAAGEQQLRRWASGSPALPG
jgi:hypothetical protein